MLVGQDRSARHLQNLFDYNAVYISKYDIKYDLLSGWMGIKWIFYYLCMQRLGNLIINCDQYEACSFTMFSVGNCRK